jgi:hypothetical protein
MKNKRKISPWNTLCSLEMTGGFVSKRNEEIVRTIFVLKKHEEIVIQQVLPASRLVSFS